MYDNLKPQPGVPRPPTASQPNPFGNAFYGAGSGLIRGGLGAYGEKILGSSSEYVQSNISRYFSDPQYYFQVNDHYVRNKLKVVLFPFLHRGHWTRITEPVGGRLSYKPPIYDINAPDLYIPFMAFGTYVVLAGLSVGLHGKFRPEALNWLFIKGLVGWFLQVALLKMSLFSLGSGEAPLLDIVAYGGYSFTGLSLAVLGKLIWGYSYYFLIPWTSLCMGIFLVKTMKRVLFAEIHGLLNAVSWGILFPIGILIARYLRTFADPVWFYSHIACQLSSYMIGVAGWGTGLKLGSQSKGIQYTSHRDFGITLFCLATLQIFALFLRPKKDHKYRFYWNIYHQGIGYGVLILGIINVFKGLEILSPEKKWKLAYIIFIAAVGGIAVCLEVITWILFLKKKPGKSTKTYDNGSNGRQQPLTS